eukprot:gene12926-biopygen10942
MARRLVDLSIPITNDVVTDPETMRPQVTYSRHKDTIPQMAVSFPGLTADDMPDGEGWAVERVVLSTHNGTHMDAPWHFHSTTDQATTTRAAPTIAEGSALLSCPRACIIASTAAVGNAIRRNRAKRRLRELFRAHQDRLPAHCDFLLIARAAVQI